MAGASVHNFKAIPVVPTATDLIDIVLSRTQRKTPTVIRRGYKIARIRAFYIRKVKYTAQTFRERFSAILEGFPRVEELHPFMAQLIGVLYSTDHLKLALGQVNSARSTTDNIGRDYEALLKHADSLYRARALKRAALGRMVTTTKKLKASMSFLEAVRQHMSRLPAIDPSERTLILTGYPNVGKSSFINKITRANVEVQPYAFTTKSLFVGHCVDHDVRYQVLDTPGLLDHPLEDMNTIEMTAVTALAHLQSCVLFFIDISEECGYSIEQQVALFHNIKPLFQNKPLLVVCTKVDLCRLDSIGAEDRALLDSVAAERGTTLLEMSNVTEDGIHAVKTEACRILLEFRVARKLQTRRVNDVLNRLNVARPERRDDRERPPSIPASVLAARAAKREAAAGAAAAAAEGVGGSAYIRPRAHAHPSSTSARNARAMAAMKKAAEAGDGAFAAMMVDEAAGAPERLERDLEAVGGGPGVYQPDERKRFMLKEEDWKYDPVPHIIDGKNVSDFFTDDVDAMLDALEREEEELERAAAEEEDEEDLLDEELQAVDMELAERIRTKKILVKKDNMSRKSNNKPVLPRKSRVRTYAEVEKKMAELGVDASKVRGRSRKRKQSVLSSRLDTGEGGGASGGGGGGGGGEGDDVGMRTRSKSAGRDASVSRGDGYTNKRQKTAAQLLLRKDRRMLNQQSKASTSDRFVPDMKPKHLFSGKRGIGKTDRR